MRAGTEVHAELHREALDRLAAQAGDRRCFVATALWGAADPRTEALRAWRDRWLLKRRWGAAAVELYCRMSPSLAGVVTSAPKLQAVLDVVLSAVARRLASWRE
jgi:hypothetical protein